MEDVVWQPDSDAELASVGDDCALLFWDVRSGDAPVLRVDGAHSKDVQCIDWSRLNPDWVATGEYFMIRVRVVSGLYWCAALPVLT